MKIILIGPGNSIHMKRWGEAIIKYGHELILVTDKKNDIRKFKVINLPNPDNKGIPMYWFLITRINMFRVKYIIRKEKPDIVHLHYISQYLTYMNDFDPFLANAWGSDIFRLEKGSYGYKFAENNIKNAKIIMTTSNEMKRLIIEKFPMAEKKIISFSWGIDTSFFKRIDGLKIKEKFNIDPFSFVFFAPRGINVPYRPELIIEAFNRIKRSGIKVNLIILSGYSTDERKVIINNIILKDKKDIFFIDKLLTPEQMVDLYSISDAYIGIPQTDQVSSALLEAMSCGCFPIVSDLEPYKGIIKDKENGLILKTCSINEMTKIMIETVNMKNKYEDILIFNRRLVEKEHNWNLQSKMMMNIYEKALKKNKTLI